MNKINDDDDDDEFVLTLSFNNYFIFMYFVPNRSMIN